VAAQQEENLHLEFKLVAYPSMKREDRRNLAKALSGFANSDGGIVVWGVDARPNEDDVDCACELREISPLAQFVSKLNQFTGDAVNPVVDGVLHRGISTTGDRGFAATLVPASDAGPHMAKAGEDRYYKRSGGSFRRMEHFDIEDMFGRRKKPKLSVSYEIFCAGVSGGPQGSTRSFRVVLGIENAGRGSARAPYLAVQIEKPFEIDWYGIDGNHNEGLERLPKRCIKQP